jgi:superfamily II DNA or RNA helicase
MRVSELVTIDKVKSWDSGDIVTIKAGTGSGKSYFIKNNLHALAKKDSKKILFLLHRTNCINQFKTEILEANKEDTIHIQSYQSIEHTIKNNRKFDFDKYDYIVCDEFHYFMSDAAFNKTTDMSLNAILNHKESIKIFMSATGDYMTKYLKGYRKLDTIDYEIPINFDYINKLTFYNKDSTLELFMNECLKKNHKAIFFIQSAEKAYKLYEKYSDHALFNCSTNNKKYYKYVDTDKINNMLINERFDESVLITTTCLDAGVNIIDQQLQHIVCDVKDIGTIIQCIGRKRLSKGDDKLYLYVRALSNQALGGYITKNRKKNEMARYLMNHTTEEFIKEYQREYDSSNMVYDDIDENGNPTKKVNLLMYCSCILDMIEMDKMKEIKFGYCKEVASRLKYKEPYRIIEEDVKELELKEYLNGIIGKKLMKEDQKKLIELIDLKDSRGRLQKGINTLNAYLKDNKLHYLIVSKRTSERVEGKPKTIRYWEIISNVEN